MRISAVIPTRGDVDMTPIISRLREYPEIDDIHVAKGDTPFNRYLHIELCRHTVIFTQDDDCLTDLRPLIEAYEPGMIVNAMTREHAAQYPGRQTLIGFGALFERGLAGEVLDPKWTRDALFFRESDRIFGTVNPHKTVFPAIEILPCAHAPNRFWKQPEHVKTRFEMEKRIFEVTGIRADAQMQRCDGCGFETFDGDAMFSHCCQ